MTDAIVAERLSKRYRRTTALREVTLRVHSGEIYGLVGLNGAGKTTFLRVLTGLARPTSGTVRVLGEELPGGAARAADRTGSLIEAPAFYPFLTGRENLRELLLLRCVRGKADLTDRIESALARVGLDGVQRRRVGAYSQGMRQRLGIAAALVADPELFVLDEPTNGLDPSGMHDVRQLLMALRAEGATVIVSSHLLAELETVCDRVGIIHHGSLIAEGSISQILRRSDVPSGEETSGSLERAFLAILGRAGSPDQPREVPQ